eukprot:UN12005
MEIEFFSLKNPKKHEFFKPQKDQKHGVNFSTLES